MSNDQIDALKQQQEHIAQMLRFAGREEREELEAEMELIQDAIDELEE